MEGNSNHSSPGDSLKRLNPHKSFLSGNEFFTHHGVSLSNTVNDYWSWAYSDLYNNIYRGILAEYIVAMALQITPPQGDFQRVVWNPYDLLSKRGKRIEVKCAAYLQSWDGDFSKISFSIAPAMTYVGEKGSSIHPVIQRNNDVYVFCVFIAKTRDVSPLDLDYWDFYVLPTSVLNQKKPKQKSISLRSLQKLNPVHVQFDELYHAVESL